MNISCGNFYGNSFSHFLFLLNNSLIVMFVLVDDKENFIMGLNVQSALALFLNRKVLNRFDWFIII